MGINDLPGPGINFRATSGAGNFQRKLSSATRYGDLKNLGDNQRAIVKAISQPSVVRAIKRGGLSRLQQLDVRRKIQAGDRTVTKEDKREIKEVLKHLSRSVAIGAKKLSAGVKTAKGGKELSREELVDRNLRRNMARDESGVRGGIYTKKYAGGNEVKSYGVHGSMGSIGIDRERAGKIGFAGNYNKSPDNAALKTPPTGNGPLGGVKPIGL